MRKRAIVIGIRLVFGLLTLTAITIQYVHLANLGVLDPVNYFSYFTNLSNIFVSVVFVISALYLIKHRQPSVLDDIVRGASVLYMAITGVVYGLLLSDIDVGGLLPWVNVQLHYIMPLVVILDWLYQPQLSKLRLKQTLLWLIFPFVFLVYSLIRGAVIGWYAYPFLDPNKVGGYGGVLGYCIGILVGFLVFSWLLMRLGNMLKRNIKG